jgi:hypothetical protein
MREKNCPECQWVSVVDSAGRRRIEMRWTPPVVAPHAPVARAA